MVSMEDAEKIAIEFVTIRRNPIKPVEVTSVRPTIGNPKGWTVRGNYVVKIGDMQNWVFSFSLDIDENGRITGYDI